jgi:hypothetical protein
VEHRRGPRHCNRNESGYDHCFATRSGKVPQLDSLHERGAGSQETCLPAIRPAVLRGAGTRTIQTGLSRDTRTSVTIRCEIPPIFPTKVRERWKWICRKAPQN